MSPGLPLTFLTLLASVVMGLWALKGPGPALLRRAATVIWGLATAGCWGWMLRSSAESGGTATLLAFGLGVVGLFAPQLQKLLSRRGH